MCAGLARQQRHQETLPPRTCPVRSDSDPPLRVVHLGSEGTEETSSAGETAGAVGVPDADDGTADPIQGNGGDAVIVTDKGGKPRRADAPQSPSTIRSRTRTSGPSLATHSAPRASALDQDAKRAYDAALGLVNAQALRPRRSTPSRLPRPLARPSERRQRDVLARRVLLRPGRLCTRAEEFEGSSRASRWGTRPPTRSSSSASASSAWTTPRSPGSASTGCAASSPHSDAARHIPAGAQTVRPDPAPARSNSGDKP